MLQEEVNCESDCMVFEKEINAFTYNVDFKSLSITNEFASIEPLDSLKTSFCPMQDKDGFTNELILNR